MQIREKLVADSSKGLKISYDWRGMPIEFLLKSTGNFGGALYGISMKYDGSGRRISKTRWSKANGAQDWEKELVTHYTGIGTEVRENLTGASSETKVVVNMPQNLGRYGVEHADAPTAATTYAWFLHDHLGSTVAVYGSSENGEGQLGLEHAYEYRSFGEMAELTSSADKVTENFTGKELDDETELGYWGARYLDLMLGLWISVDQKKQFASLYLYSGNGFNPVNFVDFEGNEIILSQDQKKLLNYINQASYEQYNVNEFGRLVSADICNEQGSVYYSERLNAGINSVNKLFLVLDENPSNDYSAYGEGVTIPSSTGVNDAISIISGKAYLNSSPAQNLLHETVSHGIPYILQDRNPNGSALVEEIRALENTSFPLPEGVPDHKIGDEL